jgi:glycosyltransferase involved in cell wall biosynthesis
VNFLDKITVLIITYNEAENIERTLNALSWARSIVIVDSGSDDGTVDLIRERYTQCRVVVRRFDTFANQCNFGLGEIATEWVLSLDADYVITESLQEEIRDLACGEYAGFRAPFRYSIYGNVLCSSLYPPRIILYRREGAKYQDEGHGHRVQVTGRVGSLNGPVIHDDRKPLSRWFESQVRYAKREADYLLTAERGQLSRVDRIRRSGWLAPLLVFPYTFLVKRCFLDGLPGWLYVLQRTIAELTIALELVDRRVRKRLKADTK